MTVEITARVIDDVAADVICVVEAENRPSLYRFNDERLLNPYEHVMLIDGNDTRGIDVGIMTTAQVETLCMRSNVDEPDPGAAGQQLFSRDCAEYQLRLPAGTRSGFCSTISRASQGEEEKRGNGRPRVSVTSLTVSSHRVGTTSS
jgi:hypothetical protein